MTTSSLGGNDHSRSGPTPGNVPEPTFAERGRTLVHLGRVGTLGTLSRRPAGGPFGSVMPYAETGGGQPVFLISSLAVHTQNLQTDARASLLVTQPGWTGDPLAGSRVTLLGRATRLSETDAAAARPAYLGRHENAAHWVEFKDFSFYRLDVEEIYYVGGFGAMGWVTAEEYRNAMPDPLAEAAPGLIDALNRQHASLIRDLCKTHLAFLPDEVLITTVDRLGFRLRVRTASRTQGMRIAFPQEILRADDVIPAMESLLKK